MIEKNDAAFPVDRLAFGLVGAIAGAVVGYFAFGFLVDQGWYSLIIPGACVGLGFGLASRRRHVVFGVISAFLGLITCVACEWHILNKGESFSEFIDGFKNEGIMTWIMLVFGVLAAYWFGVGRDTLGPAKIKIAAKSDEGVRDHQNEN